MSIEKEGTQQKGGKEGGKDQTVILGGLILVYCCVYFFFIYSIQGHDPTITSEDLSAIPAQQLSNEQQREILSNQNQGVMEFFGETPCTWQLPPGQSPSALLFIAPGCHHTSVDWWETSPSCPQCSAHPEETKVVAEALSKNWAVLVCASQELCWRKTDVHRVVPAIQEMQKRHNLENKPLYSYGISSGGYFMYFLARAIKLSGMIVQVMILGEDLTWDNSLKWNHPPVFFSFMSRDASIKRTVEIQAAGWEEKGVSVMLNELHPLPIDEFFFERRIEHISLNDSKNLQKVLKKANMLDEHNFLVSDPRDSFQHFRDQLLKVVQKNHISDSLLPDSSPILQELNVAYCKHEISSDPIFEAFEWLVSQTKQ